MTRNTGMIIQRESRFFLNYFLTLVLVFLVSCKDEGVSNCERMPDFIVSSNKAEYHVGDTVIVKGQLSDSGCYKLNLEEGSVFILPTYVINGERIKTQSNVFTYKFIIDEAQISNNTVTIDISVTFPHPRKGDVTISLLHRLVVKDLVSVKPQDIQL
jgi:hypothetical protein